MSVSRANVIISHPSLGGSGSNTWHLRSTGDAVEDAFELDGLILKVKDFYTAQADFWPSGMVCRFDGLFSGVGPSEGRFRATDPWQVTTTSTDTPLPPANCVVVNWRGASGDKSRRGRTFLGPIGKGSMDADGTPNGSLLAAYRNAAAALVTESTGFTNGAVVVWSRQESVGRDIVSSNVMDSFAVLRSRRD